MTTVLYSAQVNVPALRKWARVTPRDLGSTLIAEAALELLQGDCAAMKQFAWLSRLDTRRRRRKKKPPQ